MQDRGIAQKDKFLVKVGLAIFQTGDVPKIGLVKNEDGKYRIPSELLSNGENCFEVANKILNQSCALDRTAPFSLDMTTCITDKNELNLVFSFYANQNVEFNEEIEFFNSEDSSDLYHKDEFEENHGEVFKAAVQNG